MEKTTKQTSKPAIASLILGIISVITPLVGFLFGIAAIFFGILTLSKVKNNNMGGKGIAIAGIILGGISILLVVMFYSSYYLLSTIK